MRWWTKSRRTFVTADTHFGDEAAFTKFARPFPTVEAMDEALIESINDRVGKRDILLHLGDFAGEREWTGAERRRVLAYRDELRVRKIVLIRGNLDPLGERWFDGMFDEVHDILTWKGWESSTFAAPPMRVVASHYPIRQWQGWPNGAVHLYGHTHGTIPEEGRSTDVGVDCWRYRPLDLAKLLDSLAARAFATPAEWPRKQAMREAI
jgi:calcineurin-like phosphoesterase family protein